MIVAHINIGRLQMHKVGMHINVRSAFWYLCIKVSINFIQNTLLGSLGRNKICYSDQFVRMSLTGTFEKACIYVS